MRRRKAKMVSKVDEALQKISAARRQRRNSRVQDVAAEIAAMEALSGPRMTGAEAEEYLASEGLNVVEMSRGELILECSVLGYINCVRALETPQYRINHVNGF